MKKINETITSYFGKSFDLDAPAPILTTNIVRRVGGYVGVDFNQITPSEFYDGLKHEQEKSESDIKQMKMKDWVMFGKIAWTNLMNKLRYYSDDELEEERIREFIRNEILNVMDESFAKKYKKTPGAKIGSKVIIKYSGDRGKIKKFDNKNVWVNLGGGQIEKYIWKEIILETSNRNNIK